MKKQPLRATVESKFAKEKKQEVSILHSEEPY
jgi:hypothetical protein